MEAVDIVLIIIGASITLLFGYLTGYAVAKRLLIKASEKKALEIVETWIKRIQEQQRLQKEEQYKTENFFDNNFDIQILEWTIERAIEDEDYEEAARLSEILRDMKNDNKNN